jgi:hypothetical protein
MKDETTKILSKDELLQNTLSKCDEHIRVHFWFDTLYERYEKGGLSQQEIFAMLTSRGEQ